MSADRHKKKKTSDVGYKSELGIKILSVKPAFDSPENIEHRTFT